MPAASLKVSTTFSAIDRLTSVVRKMSRGVGSFAEKAEATAARANRAFRKLTPVFGETGRQLLDMAKTAVIAGGIIGGVVFSGKSLMEYEKQLASFRTIVSDLSNKDFKVFQAEIGKVANASRGLASTIDVASAFEKIAGLNAEFAKTASGLGKVAQATIILSKASGDDLSTSAENLVGIMNQFNLKADQASRVINVLAAGQAVGAASITQAAESYKNFGAVANGANITLEQSVALIQTLASKSITGAEAGTSLRGVILKLQKAGVGYKSGLFNINDALAQVTSRLAKTSSAKQRDAILTKIFGAENITAGKIILDNIKLYQQFTHDVTGTSEAIKAAGINSQTLGEKIDAISKLWINYITTNDQATSGLISLKKITDFVINNFATLITITINLTAGILALKTGLAAFNIVMATYGVITGIVALSTGTLTEAMIANKFVMAGAKIITGAAASMNFIFGLSLKAASVAMWLLNAAMKANPIGLVIAAIAILIGLVYTVVKYWDKWGAALAIFMGPLGMVISLVQSFRRNWDMVVRAFKTGGILGGLKAIGKVILDSVLQPIEQLLAIIGRVTGFNWAKNGAASINAFRASMGVNMDGNSPNSKPAPVLSTPAVKAETMKHQFNMNGSLNINLNDPGKQVASVQGSGPLQPNVKVTPTNGAR